jgi:putative ABC transport system permease protein
MLSGGAPEEDARRMALREIGGRESLKMELRALDPPRASEPVVFGEGLLRDVRQGIRSLRQAPGFSLVVLAVLGVGIGANVAMFTVVDAAFLRPLRFPEPERLVQIEETAPSGGTMPVAYPNFVDWEKQSQSFESMGLAGVFEETLKKAGGNERVAVGYVSPGFHGVLGVRAVHGRLLLPADDNPGAPPAAVLAHRFWQSHFGGDPDVVGRTLTVDDQVWTIAGVAAPFEWRQRADVFVPAAFALEKWGLGMREQHGNTGVVARLKAGVGLAQARAEMKRIASRLARQYPDSNGGIDAYVVPLREYIGGGIRQATLLMSGAVALLLLVACANVAGLLLARAAVRQREIAIRIALGAGRGQLIRQLLPESLLLAAGGAAAGMGVARLSLAGLERIFPAVSDLGGIGLDARVLAFSVLAAALTAVLFGLAPAVQLTRPDVIDAIKGGGRASHGGAIRLRTRKLLVAGQSALAVVLCIGAGLLVRSLIEALRTSPGFQPEQVLMAPIMPPDRKDLDLSHNTRLMTEVAERLASVPGVQAVGATDALPFSNPDSWGDFYRDDRPVPEPGKLPNAMRAAVTPGYFPAMGIPLLRGRIFSPADGRMPPLKRDMSSLLKYLQSIEMVAVINQTMARRFWPGEDPVGKSFRFGPPSLKGPRVIIVGVVGDARQRGLDRPVAPQYYFSAEQFPLFEARLVVRTTQDVSGLAPMIRGIVAERQPDAVVARVETMEGLIGRSLAGRRSNVLLLGLFSGITLLLAALGLYATMAYLVAQRTQEIGLRMVLGAGAADDRRMVLREGAVLAGAGGRRRTGRGSGWGAGGVKYAVWGHDHRPGDLCGLGGAAGGRDAGGLLPAGPAGLPGGPGGGFARGVKNRSRLESRLASLEACPTLGARHVVNLWSMILQVMTLANL